MGIKYQKIIDNLKMKGWNLRGALETKSILTKNVLRCTFIMQTNMRVILESIEDALRQDNQTLATQLLIIKCQLLMKIFTYSPDAMFVDM